MFLRCFINSVALKISNRNCEFGCCDECHGCLTAEESGVGLFVSPKVMSLFSEVLCLWGPEGEEEELFWSRFALTGEQS